MAKRDYYETLNVARDADKNAIKKAYRKLARQYHPDVNKDAGAEDRFKEVNEAYEVLSDENKRARYDRFGHAGVENGAGGFSGGFDGFQDIGDIFETFFGGGFGGGRRRRNAAQRGADLRYNLVIEFEEAVFGTEKDIEVQRLQLCNICNGSGAEPGTSPKTCHTCNGAGEVRRQQQTILGSFVNVSTCPTCNGSGEEVDTPCHQCNGRKFESQKHRIKVKVPAGVDDDMQIRLSQEGQPGLNGGPAGNLYVILNVKPHAYFQRRGDDIFVDLEINVAQATLGDDIVVPTLEGETSLTIPAGTQPGKVFKLRGKGAPRLDRTGRGHIGRGDQHVIIQVGIPKKLTNEQRDLFHQLSATMGNEVKITQEKGFWDNVKDMFGFSE